MSFFRYPGGKKKLSSIIVDNLKQLNQNKKMQYREPFMGGGGICFKFLDQAESIWINDKDIGISCLWTSVINYPDELQELVMNLVPSTKYFYLFKDMLLSKEDMPLDKDSIVNYGFMKLAIHQMSYSGLGTKSGGPLGGVSQESKYKIDCRWSPAYICQKIVKNNEILKLKKIHSGKCTNVDFEDCIRDESELALIYLDPPYYIKGNDLYQHGFTYDNHKRLSESLKNSNHEWLLSYDACEEIKTLYSWADIQVIDVNYSITSTKNANTGKRSSLVKPEFLIRKRV
jgi:DNA adenine methylase